MLANTGDRRILLTSVSCGPIGAQSAIELTFPLIGAIVGDIGIFSARDEDGTALVWDGVRVEDEDEIILRIVNASTLVFDGGEGEPIPVHDFDVFLFRATGEVG